MKVPFVLARKIFLEYEPAAQIATCPDDCGRVEVVEGWLKYKDLEQSPLLVHIRSHCDEYNNMDCWELKMPYSSKVAAAMDTPP